MNFTHTIPCTRPFVSAWADDFGNTLGAPRPLVTFEAVFVPKDTQIVDGPLRESTVTKPTLYVDGRPDVRSGDPITVDGDPGWQVDGDPIDWPSKHPWSGWSPPMVIELRRTVG